MFWFSKILRLFYKDIYTDMKSIHQPASITRKRPPSSKQRWNPERRRMHTTFLTGPTRWFWHDCVPDITGSTHRKLKIVPSPTCPCGEDQTTEHVIQVCNRHQPERIAQWPSATPLHHKLYGGLEDLKKITNFITAAGLVV